MRLLVVEDEKSLRDDITKKLRLDGYEADACGDGNEARELLAVEYYDLVLLDLNLPGVDGSGVRALYPGSSDFWFQCETVYISYYCTGIKAGWRQAFDLQCHDRDDFKLYRDYGCPDDICD